MLIKQFIKLFTHEDSIIHNLIINNRNSYFVIIKILNLKYFSIFMILEIINKNKMSKKHLIILH